MAVIGGVAAGGYLLGKDSRSLEQIATDATITGNVKTALLRNETINAWNINVDTFEGDVILHGHVENAAELKLAEEIAAAVKNVKTVNSRLKVIGVDVKDASIENKSE